MPSDDHDVFSIVDKWLGLALDSNAGSGRAGVQVTSVIETDDYEKTHVAFVSKSF